ncbi:MAG: threonine synthase, partial [Clostridia bacterium]|nr:threonine synthase [Clostridia bacterium]
MDSLVHKAYEDKFDCEELTPTKSVGDMHVLELFHGPTYAFKDVALCMLPQLLTAALKKKNQTKEVRIITATSGDTGKAALEGFKDVENISICVFFPHEGVSQIQKKQMITQRGNNVHVAAVKGNFDDIQSEVKKIFVSNKCSETNYNLSSANSINIGRLTPQIMYYFKAYSDLIADGTIACGDKVNFSVPTGNFGDILAGFLAMKLGLPINKLICASNANNVLTDFINTGAYNKCRSLVKTSSPSMDILISSNLERLLYFLCEDVDCVAKLMNDLDEKGQYQISKTMLDDIQALFWGEYCDNQQTQDVIGRVYNKNKYLCDPHTSCGWFAAEQYRNKTNDTTPMAVSSTASPYKYTSAVLAALSLDS